MIFYIFVIKSLHSLILPFAFFLISILKTSPSGDSIQHYSFQIDCLKYIFNSLFIEEIIHFFLQNQKQFFYSNLDRTSKVRYGTVPIPTVCNPSWTFQSTKNWKGRYSIVVWVRYRSLIVEYNAPSEYNKIWLNWNLPCGLSIEYIFD